MPCGAYGPVPTQGDQRQLVVAVRARRGEPLLRPAEAGGVLQAPDAEAPLGTGAGEALPHRQGEEPLQLRAGLVEMAAAGPT
ncbi:hypothetical protein [Streptomyces sp. NRRL B-1347]|uniref:hypothetical protein n=1 Tax=Streptomyces sp. NRRL B-1347 TaxID=1476877 RepID=UPI00131AF007|nr:hypothetical protein [Streptomyces sp. NRRL B-1347]